MTAGTSTALSPSPHNPRSGASPTNEHSASPSPLRDSRSLSSTLSSRLRHGQTSTDRVPVTVAALAVLPARERIRVETQFLEDMRKRQSSRPMSGRKAEQPVTVQSQRRQLKAIEIEQKHCAEHQRLEERLAAAELRKQTSARGAPKLNPSPWATAPDHGRGHFQLWNREGAIPQFVLSNAHRDRAPAVGTYGKSTSIELDASLRSTGSRSTPRCASCSAEPETSTS